MPLAALALVGATGCTEPSPYVTLYAGSRVVKARAVRFCHEPDRCIADGRTTTLVIDGRREIGIDVPGSVAKAGWRILEVQGEDVSHERYRRLPPLSFPSGQKQALTVVQVGRDDQETGRWQFSLVGG